MRLRQPDGGVVRDVATQQALAGLEDCHFETLASQGRGDFQPDDAATHHDRMTARRHGFRQSACVVDVAQIVDPAVILDGQGTRMAPRRDHELIVTDGLAVGQNEPLAGAVDVDRFSAQTNIDPKLRPTFGIGQKVRLDL